MLFTSGSWLTTPPSASALIRRPRNFLPPIEPGHLVPLIRIVVPGDRYEITWRTPVD
jgi:hypothetical protein